MAITFPQEAQPSHVLGAGAVGGFLSWVFAVTVGVPPVLREWWLAILATLVLGAGAAYIGVYLLASSDTTRVHRCLAFALLCGFAWKPVWDAGSALVGQSVHQRELRSQAQHLEVRSREVVRTLTKASPQEAPQAVAEAVRVADQLTDVADATEATDPALAADLRLQAAATVTAAAETRKRVRGFEPGEMRSAAGPLPALPLDSMRALLARGQRSWVQRDPEQAKRFGRALADLDRAAAPAAETAPPPEPH